MSERNGSMSWLGWEKALPDNKPMQAQHPPLGKMMTTTSHLWVLVRHLEMDSRCHEKPMDRCLPPRDGTVCTDPGGIGME